MTPPTSLLVLRARFRKAVIPVAGFVIMTGAMNAFAGSPSLIAIPTLSGDIASIGRAITPDGLWVVGESYYTAHRGFLYDVATSNLYNVVAGGQSTTASGVCYRTNNGQQQIIIGAIAAGWNGDFCFTNGAPTGAFVGLRRDIYNTGGHPNPVTAPCNTRTSGGDDVFWSGWTECNDGPGYWAAVAKGSGDWTATVANDYDTTTGNKSYVYGLSGAGRAVGVKGSLNGWVWDWTGSGTPVSWQFNGMDGSTQQEPFSISADGTVVFGRSYSSDPFNRPQLWPYKATFDTTMPGPATQLSINELPSFPDTAPSAGSPGSAGLPYGCTADGKYAVGYSYRGVEKAVLWDASDPNPANWTVLDLMQLATAQGITGDFTSLDRALSVGITPDGDLAITGYGTTDEQRAFLMIIPRPLSAYSVFPPSLTISNSPAGRAISFNSILPGGPSYPVPTPLTNYLEYATALGDSVTPTVWTTLTDAQSTGSEVIFVDTNPPDPQGFYRVRTQ